MSGFIKPADLAASLPSTMLGAHSVEALETGRARNPRTGPVLLSGLCISEEKSPSCSRQHSGLEELWPGAGQPPYDIREQSPRLPPGPQDTAADWTPGASSPPCVLRFRADTPHAGRERIPVFLGTLRVRGGGSQSSKPLATKDP